MSFLCIHDGHITTIKRIEQDLFTATLKPKTSLPTTLPPKAHHQ
jgi:hypothetical protein